MIIMRAQQSVEAFHFISNRYSYLLVVVGKLKIIIFITYYYECILLLIA